MRRYVYALTIGSILFAGTVSAQTAGEIVAKYIKAVGGADAVAKITTVRQDGKYLGGGGFEARYVQLNKRPGKVREELTFAGLTGAYAYDGHTGWKIEPWGGKKEPESMEDEELQSIVEDADFDGPLVNYREKGNTIEYLGAEDVEGTDTYKLRVSVKSGGVRTFFLDKETCMPIKIEVLRNVRGADKFYEVWPGEYKLVAGWYRPFSVETNAKGSTNKVKTSYEKIEANIPLEDALFTRPGGTTR